MYWNIDVVGCFIDNDYCCHGIVCNLDIIIEMRKIIFLDIDGMLNTKHWDKNAVIDKYGYAYDPAAISNLKMILDETGAEIVISSSWKCMGLAKLQEMWSDRKLPGKVVDVTPNSVGDEFLLHANLDNMDLLAIRGQEIKEWLMLHGKDVSNYVILDDMNDILQEQMPYFVWIDPDVDITKENAKQAIMIRV